MTNFFQILIESSQVHKVVKLIFKVVRQIYCDCYLFNYESFFEDAWNSKLQQLLSVIKVLSDLI